MRYVATFILLSIFTSPALAEITTGTKEVLLNNKTVKVVRATYPAGAESGMHTHIHPNRVAYFIQGGKLELTPFDEQQPSKILDITDGSTLFLPAMTHNVKNIGDTEVILIETEIK